MTTIAEDRQRLIYKGRVLQDESVLEDYQIEEGHTIHMVARPAEYETLQSDAATSSTAAATAAASSSSLNSSSLSPSTTSLQNLLALSALSGLGETGLSDLNTISEKTEDESLEAITQGLLTTQTFMSMSNSIDHEQCDKEEESAEELLAKRTFYLGQWLDVKDTVNQWLEVGESVVYVYIRNLCIFCRICRIGIHTHMCMDQCS